MLLEKSRNQERKKIFIGQGAAGTWLASNWRPSVDLPSQICNRKRSFGEFSHAVMVQGGDNLYDRTCQALPRQRYPFNANKPFWIVSPPAQFRETEGKYHNKFEGPHVRGGCESQFPFAHRAIYSCRASNLIYFSLSRLGLSTSLAPCRELSPAAESWRLLAGSDERVTLGASQMSKRVFRWSGLSCRLISAMN